MSVHGNIKDLKGNRYGSLTVLELTDLKLEHKRGAVWKCLCDCGNICYKTSGDLQDKRRLTCSCGCQSKRKRKFPNKFVAKEPLTRGENVRNVFAKRLMERFKDAAFAEELQKGIREVLAELNSENK